MATTTTTTRFARRAAAALLAAGSIAGLASVPAFAAPAAPAPAPAATAPAPAPAATAPAPATPAAETESDASFTKGTRVTFRNDTGSTVWVREHEVFTSWFSATALQPGQSKAYTGNFAGVDDVQLRVFRSAEDAKENSVFKAIEVDGENPAWGCPWLSVSYQSKSYWVGTVHHYVSPIAGAAFTGKRHGDTSHYKQFELTMTKGWS